MPNCLKHSVSKLLDCSCRSTSAARAENFLEEDKGTREFPKAFSVLDQLWWSDTLVRRFLLHMWGGRPACQPLPIVAVFPPLPPTPSSSAHNLPPSPHHRPI